MQEELTIKGIILSAAPQGEYGKRISLLTDRLGRITVFASGAAKMNSHVIGKVRPMTSAEFDLAKGRGAWNLRSVRVIDSFEELALDIDAAFYAAYILELGEYFSQEGMEEEEAKGLLNLMFVTLKALRDKQLPPELIRRICELRILKLQGEYTLEPAFGTEELSGGQADALRGLWRHCLESSLTGLYDTGRLRRAVGPAPGGAARAPEGATPAAHLRPGDGIAESLFEEKVPEFFERNVEVLFKQQFSHHFRSLDILRAPGL